MITHPSIDSAICLRDQLAAASIAPETISLLRARVNRLVPQVAGNPRPGTGLEGKFSIAFCIAAGLLERRATPDVFTEARVCDPRVATLLSRIEILVDESVGEQQSIIEAEADGQRFSIRTEMARGSSANPLSDDDLSAKFVALAEPTLSVRTKDALADLWAFDAIDDVGDWVWRLGREQV